MTTTITTATMLTWLLTTIILGGEVLGLSTPKNALKTVTTTTNFGLSGEASPMLNCSRRNAIQSAFGVSTFLMTNSIIRPSNAAYIDPNSDVLKVTKRVYLDVQLPGDEKPKRLIIGLFGDAMPKTAENFEKLCTGINEGGMSYAGTTFYRVLSDMTIQGGAIGDDSGKTGQSSFPNGATFEPDNFNIKHSREGLVSMVRGVGGGADSRFFINTSADGGWADDRYAAFGVVEKGMDFVHKIEKVDVKPPQNRPILPVKIVASGALPDLKDEIVTN